MSRRSQDLCTSVGSELWDSGRRSVRQRCLTNRWRGVPNRDVTAPFTNSCWHQEGMIWGKTWIYVTVVLVSLSAVIVVLFKALARRLRIYLQTDILSLNLNDVSHALKNISGLDFFPHNNKQGPNAAMTGPQTRKARFLLSRCWEWSVKETTCFMGWKLWALKGCTNRGKRVIIKTSF